MIYVDIESQWVGIGFLYRYRSDQPSWSALRDRSCHDQSKESFSDSMMVEVHVVLFIYFYWACGILSFIYLFLKGMKLLFK